MKLHISVSTLSNESVLMEERHPITNLLFLRLMFLFLLACTRVMLMLGGVY